MLYNSFTTKEIEITFQCGDETITVLKDKLTYVFHNQLGLYEEIRFEDEIRYLFETDISPCDVNGYEIYKWNFEEWILTDDIELINNDLPFISALNISSSNGFRHIV